MRYRANRFICSGIIVIAATLGGCHSRRGICGVDHCADVPCGAIPGRPGNHLCQWQQAQVRSASTDLGVFYQADFVGTSEQLGPAAQQRVASLIQQGSIGTVPLIVEPSDDPQRDMARTISLASALSAGGATITSDQIQVAYPPALGLEGFRAQQVARTASRSGGQGGGQGGGGAGLGGGGLGGGGGVGGGGAGGSGLGGGGIF